MDQLFNFNTINIQNDGYFNKESTLTSIEKVEKDPIPNERAQTVQISEDFIQRNQWSQFKDKLTKSEFQDSSQKPQQLQLTIEDLIQIRDQNQKKINNFISSNNEIFDEELEQVFRKIDINSLQNGSHSFSVNSGNNYGKQGSMVKRYKTDSGLIKDTVRDSIQQLANQQQLQNLSQLQNKQALIKRNSNDSRLLKMSSMSQQQQEDILHKYIQCQNKIMSQINFYVLSISFINKQIIENRENWLHKILCLFVQLFTEFWRNKDITLDTFSYDFSKNILKINENQNIEQQKQSDSKINIMNKKQSGDSSQDAPVPLLKKNSSQVKDSKGIYYKEDIIIETTEQDIQRQYVELNKFINIYRYLIKTYYDIPFISKKFENSDFFMDDILWNYSVNLIFPFSVNSNNIYSHQLQMSVEVLQNKFQVYKKKFSSLAQKEPQFYQIKDKFCLNHLTKMYILKQMKLENEKKASTQPLIKDILRNENIQQVDDNQNLQRRQSNQSQGNQSQHCNSLTNANCLEQSSQRSCKNQQSTLDMQYMKLKEVEERKLERERLSKHNPVIILPVSLPGVEEKDSNDSLTDIKMQEDGVKEDYSYDQQEREESKEEHGAGINDTREEEDIKMEIQQEIKKGSHLKQGNDIIQSEELKSRDSQNDQQNVIRNKSLISKQFIINKDILQSYEQKSSQEMNGGVSIPFERCIYYLKKIIYEQKPIRKLKLILKAFENIQKCIQGFYDKNNSNEKVKIGPEDLMDITVYILAKSQQHQIIHDIYLVRQFITKNTENSDKAGYYLQTLETAFQYIIETEFQYLDDNIRVSFSNSYKSFCGGEHK